MEILRAIWKCIFILLFIGGLTYLTVLSQPRKCCYVCEHPINDTDTYCKHCAYPLDSIIVKKLY